MTALVVGVCALVLPSVEEPMVVRLWEGGPPGFEARRDEPEQAQDYWVKNIHHPSLTVFLPPPEKATGTAVVICPGGGHRLLVYNAEGVEAARFLNELGVAAFVLKYRLGREEGSPYQIDVHARADGLRAVRLVRSRAAEWGIDPARVGLMGFSAGGEVVSMVALGSEAAELEASDPVDRLNGRPDFGIWIYPGPLGIPEALPPEAPPAFLLVANDDRGAARSVMSLLAKYRAADRPVEAHILAGGGHAFNMGKRSERVSVRGWPGRLAEWLADLGYLDRGSR
ncbi:MAG: hypothetical protein KatS3mg108_3007 [Isosphaeraceae bacterium]|jgi:acetyl esterase/lipase|nr:MAG: hypothetical protein KatS3mg108_3007 [Isosphaeraceae bacterium]